MSKLPSKLETQLFQIVKQGFKDEIPRSKKGHWEKNGLGIPLSARMMVLDECCESKIIALRNSRSLKHGYANFGDAASALAERIARRYKVTWMQHARIERLVFQKYRGKERPYRDYREGEYTDFINYENTSFEVGRALTDACEKAKKSINNLPLRVLIDPRVTNILLLMYLNEQIYQLKWSSKKWTQTK